MPYFSILLLLGGSAKVMKRHKNVGKFVQKGTNRAEIKITVWNSGEDGYKQDTYGDTIVFERTIYANGQSNNCIRRGDTMSIVCNGSKLVIIVMYMAIV